MLYLVELRVSHLLLFIVAHAKELFEKNNPRIQLFKGGEKRFPLRLSPKGQRLFPTFKEDFIKFSSNKKKAGAPFITASNHLTKVIARETFDKELNKILAIVSAQLEKHLRTNSFKATLISISELLKSTPIDEVKELIEHRSIRSSLGYKRSKLQPRQMDKILIPLKPL